MRMRGLSWNRTKCVDCKAEEESELGIVSFSVRDGSTAVCMHFIVRTFTHTDSDFPMEWFEIGEQEVSNIPGINNTNLKANQKRCLPA